MNGNANGPLGKLAEGATTMLSVLQRNWNRKLAKRPIKTNRIRPYAAFSSISGSGASVSSRKFLRWLK